QLTDDPFAGQSDAYRKGDIVTSTVSATTENGLEVTVGENMTGFIRRTDLSRDRAEQRVDRFAVGEKVDAIITSVDKKTRKLALSIKARESAEEKQAMAEYGSSDSGASLGDILGAALAKRETDDEK
ncbi:MAG: S1 RNA-binding domain-containing protein, partial [Alphaproteobacteria bacterium]